PDPKRRSPASRPAKSAKSGKPGDAGKGRPRTGSAVRREPRQTHTPAQPQPEGESSADSIRQSIAETAEQQSEQRLGSAARRAGTLPALVCVLALAIPGTGR